jgi:hypothetical protein
MPAFEVDTEQKSCYSYARNTRMHIHGGLAEEVGSVPVRDCSIRVSQSRNASYLRGPSTFILPGVEALACAGLHGSFADGVDPL